MAGKNLDIAQLAADLDVLRKLNAQQREADEKLYRELMDVSSWWRGTSAEAMEAWAARSYAAVTAVRDETELDIESTQVYINKLAAKDRQYAKEMAAFGSGNRIGTNVGTVGTGTVAGTYTMEFKNWLSQVTGISDFEANARHFERIGVPVQKVNEIYTELTKNGVTPYHIEKLKNIGVSFDNVAVSFSKLGNETDKKIYSYLMKGGDYFDDLESRKPGSWKGMLTKVNGDGELEQSTKIALIDVEKGIGAYYRNKYNVNSYAKTGDTAINKATPNEKILFNLCFEAANPRFSASIDTFFAQAGEEAKKYTEQIRDIKFIAYSAPLSYQTVFLGNIEKIGIGTLNQGGTQYYNSGDKKVYINLSDAKKTDSGPYQTFFHECGHAIDDILREEGSISQYYTERFIPLKGAMITDVETWIRAELQGKGLTKSQEDRVVRNLIVWERNSSERNGTEVLTPQEEQVKDDVMNYFKSIPEIDSEVGGIPSDIFGAITNDTLVGRYSHAGTQDYWMSEYSIAGVEILGIPEQVMYKDHQMAELELFAENFAAEMVGDIPSLNSEASFLPNSKEMVDKIVQDKSCTILLGDQSMRYNPSNAQRK